MHVDSGLGDDIGRCTERRQQGERPEGEADHDRGAQDYEPDGLGEQPDAVARMLLPVSLGDQCFQPVHQINREKRDGVEDAVAE